ncbi:hypothetical protein Cgig2_003799 [Carnegiea gigantea]|uniref:Uncharacterized protein n=1 Tax=Carnegiea gigantea TaxID=171969 RepID=A0A9Q1GTE7_9CARY|nr:hypothetical protein Cgig2_003799 [Carnegiea gigantea]
MSDHSNPAQDPTVDHKSYGKVVEIVDESGNVTKKKDFKSKDIHKLRDGDRVLVQFSAGQPIGDSRSALSRWMASLMKEPNLCPRDAKDFKEVKENYGAESLRNLRLKFLIPERVDAKKAFTDIFGIKFRSIRHKQNKHFFQQAEGNLQKNLKTIQQAAGLFDDDLEQTLKQHQFAVTEIEEELDKLRRSKDFSAPQWSKYKNYLKSTGFKNDAKARMESHRASGLCATEVEIDKEVWTHFMGDDKPGRAQLFGTGVTKSQVKRLHDGSLITRNNGDTVLDQPVNSD